MGLRAGMTNLESPHFERHMQWNVCAQGIVTSPVADASIRSRQTGHVGISVPSSPKREIAWEVASSGDMETEEMRTT
jgi:hypothetical protein